MRDFDEGEIERLVVKEFKQKKMQEEIGQRIKTNKRIKPKEI
jgi:hypothetical protein